MEMSDELLCRVALGSVKGMTLEQARRLEAMGWSAGRLMTTDLQTVTRETRLNPSLFNDSVRAAAMQLARAEIEFVKSHRINLIWWQDEAYPRRLAECDDAPLMLYSLGQANLNPRYSIGIVGTRNATVYGISFIGKLVEELKVKLGNDLLIVSGLALGCDIAAHRAAMKCGVPTAAVLAHGLDTLYPPGNRNDAVKMISEGSGILISDYPHGTRPFRGNFLARNRIVAGMADCLVVAESAAEHGGALYTARLAREYNREVLALPGRVGDKFSGGCNKLIRTQVAQLCENADQLIEAMGWAPLPAEQPLQQQLFADFTPEEEAVIEYLRRNGEGDLNAMAGELKYPVGKMMALLMKLEIEGHILSLPGSRFRPA